MKDGLGPDQEMLSYPIKFIKVNIFINTVILGSGFAQRIHIVNGENGTIVQNKKHFLNSLNFSFWGRNKI